MTPLENLLAKLSGVKKSGNGWSARCPVHHDRKPSLSIGQVRDGTFPTDPGHVLIIDNELHPETSAHRIPKVAAACNIPLASVGPRLHVQNLRGRWQDIFSLGTYFRSLEPGRFQLIILDAMYRFLPRQMDENDNGTMANVYNAIDRYADLLGCCFVLIHHTSKGNQSAKAITDVKPILGYSTSQGRCRRCRGGLDPRVWLPPADLGGRQGGSSSAGILATRPRKS